MDLEQYRQASQAIWEAMAGGWGREREYVWLSSRAVGEALVAGLDPAPGDTVLELAAGPGDTGFVAAARIGDQGRLISTDFAAAMVDEARANAERLGIGNVDFRQMDAEQIDLADDSVDGILCRFGYMLMADPALALAESRRVLRPGGRLAFGVWGSPADNPWAAIPASVMVELGHVPAPNPDDPGIFALADPGRIRNLVTGAGFGEPRIDEVSVRWPINDTADLHRFVDELAGPIKLVLDSISETDRADAWRVIEERAAPYLDGAGIPGSALTVVSE
jgi:SAM-dependent methyltransferase